MMKHSILGVYRVLYCWTIFFWEKSTFNGAAEILYCELLKKNTPPRHATDPYQNEISATKLGRICGKLSVKWTYFEMGHFP